MELTKEQQLAKLKLELQIREDYTVIIPKFVHEQIFNLPELAMVLTTAYGVNREEIFFDCLCEYLRKRQKAINTISDSNQTLLFGEK